MASALEQMQFQGEFREYQRRVLDHSAQYLKDGKLNIVAAPGSGKTILGLECIRRIGAPCLILSPTTAIRQQWGERLKQMFLSEPADYETLFSNDLHDLRVVNSITYQALYSAMERVPITEEGEADYSDVDLFEEIKKHGIMTVCLDEAHHLKNEWHRALDKFLQRVGGEVTLLSFTATPPYDSEISEWNRFKALCGEIDEEIFVPELVAEETLCPHQDYIYFNYPTKEETAVYDSYKQEAGQAIEELGQVSFLARLCRIINNTKDYGSLYTSAKEYIALMVLLEHYGYNIRKKTIRQMTTKKRLPAFTMDLAETAVQFLLDGDLLTGEEKESIYEILKSHQVISKRKVALVLGESVKKQIVSSVGKLKSIEEITKQEYAGMGEKLRMLVLTDYIRREQIGKIGTQETFSDVHVVSIFETIRRCQPEIKAAVLSGSLIILPDTAALAAEHKRTPLGTTGYSVITMSGSNHDKVRSIGELFTEGRVQALVGTKSLLGEGWDAPCINTLILASFVGSYVLSNQMRGRAVRIDRQDPMKTANIWHLVTVEPEYIYKDKFTEQISERLIYEKKELVSCDYDVLKRRFDAFMGPNYETGVIESGIERISIIKPPYDEAGIAGLNAKMLECAANRNKVMEQWQSQVGGSRFAVEVETKLLKPKRAPVPIIQNVLVAAALMALQGIMAQSVVSGVVFENSPTMLFRMVLWLAIGVVLYLGIGKLILHRNPARSVKTLGTAVYRTMVECGMVSSAAKVESIGGQDSFYVGMYLRNATLQEQNLFHTAMRELLSPIENPRYVLLSKGKFSGYRYYLSYACPEILGKNRETVDILAKHLHRSLGRFEPVYVHGEKGRALILKCRRRSYITRNRQIIDKKYKVSYLE